MKTLKEFLEEVGGKEESIIEYKGKEALEEVKQNGHSLRYVREQTPEICLEAVKENGYALQYVREQTEEICLEAVKQDGYALQYVKEQTPEICLEAVKENLNALQFVDKNIFKQKVKEYTMAELQEKLGEEFKIIK